MKKTLIFVLLVASISYASSLLADQEYCPCVPTSKHWVIRTCDSWNCAVGALVGANGNALTFALPVSTTDAHWMIFQRVVSGSFALDQTEPRQVESFERIGEAAARLSSIAAERTPMIVTSPDSLFLVVSLKEITPARRRPTAR